MEERRELEPGLVVMRVVGVESVRKWLGVLGVLVGERLDLLAE